MPCCVKVKRFQANNHELVFRTGVHVYTHTYVSLIVDRAASTCPCDMLLDDEQKKKLRRARLVVTASLHDG